MQYQDILDKAKARDELAQQIKEALVEELDLPVSPDEIDSDQPLFGRGLELDSLDTLEIVSVVEERFAAYITDEDGHVLGSVNKLVDAVQEQSA